MRKYLLAIILLFISFSFPRSADAAACPNPGDTKVYVNPTNNLCYSASDPLYNTGFNTTGGSVSTCGTGGQVRCPGSTTNLPNGNVCIVKTGTQCFPGYGTSGFNTPGCAQQSTTPLPKCPSPMNLTIKAVDAQGKGIPNINFTVMYEDVPSTNYVAGKTATAISDSTGTAVVSGTLYSGDHFSITASSPYYNITPARIGNLTNIGQYEMNTTFSCGTQLENGQSNAPCTFTVAPNGTQAAPAASPTPTPLPDDPTVASAFDSVDKTLLMLGVVGIVGLVVVGVGGGGKV